LIDKIQVMTVSRRKFLIQGGIVTLGFVGLQKFVFSNPVNTRFPFYRYGRLQKDPLGVIDLPEGFSYKIISRVGDLMDDGFYLPGKPDGMAAFPLDNDRCIVVRNHELSPSQYAKEGPFGKNNELLTKLPADQVYDFGKGELPAVGGTTNFVYNLKEAKIEKQFLSLVGTNRNCAGGATPWGSWLTCEEDTTKAGGEKGRMEKNHGYVFEVPATDKIALAQPKPIKNMGRFNHEAVCVDPRTGIVYLTEDTHDSLIYRFIPKVKDDLHQGGKLQALKIKQKSKFDTRNWDDQNMQIGKDYLVEWIDMDEVDSVEDDLRYRGFEKGAAVFARGEGIWFGENEFYFACTSGGKKKNGQIFRYKVSEDEGTQREVANPSKLELFIQPDNSDLMSFCDNLTIAPWGDIVLCEDTNSPRVIGITKEGQLYPIAHNVGHRSEFAGACFSPDGSVLFVNVQDAGLTLAITGPWNK
jgi:uncharacterized protein